jgi:hypothetical protein
MNDSTIVEINEPTKRVIGEEEWSTQTEELARKWSKTAQEASEAHTKAGLAHKHKHVIIGLPATLIPICMAPISATLAHTEGIQYANMIGFLASGCLSGIHTFFGFDKLHQKHMDFAGRYGDICSDVDYELSKARRFRVSSDQFLMRIQLKLDGLNGSAPDL